MNTASTQSSASTLKLAGKHWLRDFSSAEMRLLLIATLVAAMTMAMITTFTDRLTRTMSYRASELIGGDIVLEGQQRIPDSWVQQANDQGLANTSAVIFSTMAYARDNLQLSRVSAVEDGYPLKGENKISTQAYGQGELVKAIPKPGNVWAEQRILQALSIDVGDVIELGDAQFKVSYILQQDADRSGNFYSPFGKLMMNTADLDKTGIIAPGSRVEYKQYFLGTGDELDAANQVESFASWLEPKLGKHYELEGAVNSDTSMGTAVQRAQQYLGLASLISVLLAGVAIAMASRQFSERHYQTAALLRCLGAAQNTITQIFLTKLMLTGIIAAMLGALLGFLAHYGLLGLMSGLLPTDIQPARWSPVLISLVASLIVLLAFAMAPIQQLRKVSPVRVLRRELNPTPVKLNIFYLAAIAAMGLLAYILTGQLKLTVSFIAGLSLLALLYGGLAASFLIAIHKFTTKLPRQLQTGFNQLYRHRYYAISQLGAFAFIFTAITLIIVVRTDLFSRWQASIPEDTPNHFAINILPDRAAAFDSFLKERGINTSASYPIVRGRLTEINGEPFSKAVSKEEKEEEEHALHRELSLTWRATLSDDSTLTDGDWWSNDADATDNQVSVESELAENLDISVGDVLTYSISGENLTAKVTSIRQVKWDNFKPNFYMVFRPGVLENYHHTYINSFYLAEQNNALLLELNRAFKAVTIIPTQQIIDQVQEVLEQTTVAVEYILLLVLLAGIVLLFATLLSTLSLRRHEAAIYRTLGASGRYIAQLIIYEYLWLGALAGILAMLSTELLSGALYEFVFEAEWQFHSALWLLTPLVATAIIVSSGWFASRPVMQSTPNQLLREVG